MGKRKKVIWSEPKLPPFIKINPDSPPGIVEGLQPGDRVITGGQFKVQPGALVTTAVASSASAQDKVKPE